jgi:hypothetical protein
LIPHHQPPHQFDGGGVQFSTEHHKFRYVQSNIQLLQVLVSERHTDPHDTKFSLYANMLFQCNITTQLKLHESALQLDNK